MRMTKRMMNLLLAVCVAVVMSMVCMPTKVYADTQSLTQSNVQYTDYMPPGISWYVTGWVVPAGNYRLESDIVLKGGGLEISEDVTLDLNGHTITRPANSIAVYVRKGGKLTLNDTLKSGRITSNMQALYIGGTLVMNGGTISGPIAAHNIGGGTFYAHGGIIAGTFNNDGVITRSADAEGYTTFSRNPGRTSDDSQGTIDDNVRFTIGFNSQGGSEVSSQTALKGQFTMPVSPTKTDSTNPEQYEYVFDGWYTASEGGTKVTDLNTLNGDTTLYAYWTKIIKQEYVTSLEEQIKDLNNQLDKTTADLAQAQKDLDEALLVGTEDAETISRQTNELNQLQSKLDDAQKILNDTQSELVDEKAKTRPRRRPSMI